MSVMMHPGYESARSRLQRIRRYIKLPLTKKDVEAFRQLWDIALEKEDCGRQCVRFVDDLIEQNTPLKW
ncbi:hypothetical protein [Bradyrhizobium sp. USDA 241]|uniref:hypothetical protein n=1 Tax=Bradyrhizobium sp. USDA 241 TaxID=3377725 RepID=UPI003C70EEA1